MSVGFITGGALKEKRVLKQYPWDTTLENGAFSDKKGTILVPLGQQNDVVPPVVPQERHFPLNGALATKRAPFSWKGHYFSAHLTLFLYSKCMKKQCPLGKWHQNGALKGTVLRTIKPCPRGTILVPLIFLSVFIPYRIIT